MLPSLDMSMSPVAEHERICALDAYQIMRTPPELSFDRLVTLAATIFHVPLAFLAFIDQEHVWIKSHAGWNGTTIFPRHTTICAATLLHKQLHFLSAPLSGQTGYMHLFPFVDGFSFYAGVAIRTHQMHPIGVLCIADTVPRTLSDDNQVVLQHLASLVLDELDLRLAIQQVIAVEQQRSKALQEASMASMLAHTDALTGIANRRAFDRDGDRYQLAIATGEVNDVLIAVMDVNGLKQVNDTYGHQAGDTLLRTFAQVLHDMIRHEDHVYRFGGDEFAVVMRAAKDSIHELRHRIDDVMHLVREQTGFTMTGVSVGIASVRESHGQWDRTVQCADERMYAEKHIHRQRQRS